MKFINKNKTVWLVLLILAVLLPLNAVHAEGGIGGAISGFFYDAIGGVFFFITWLAGVIAGFLLMVVGWFIETFLQLNEGIVNSYIVQVGFKVTLSIANLAFVAGIVIIAIATILRRETYGIKQILWKLIVAAILVNFSLVFAGAIINFSDQVTRSFMNSAFPVDGEGSSTNQFSKKMMAAFAPQKLSDSVTSALKNTTTTDISARVEEELSVAGGLGKGVAAIISPIISSIMTVIGLVMTLIVMAVFAFMLLARYVILTFLLILTPLIWAAWIFPSTEHHVKDWTKNFFKWTFFGPLVMFSMWLVITMGGEIQNGHVAILKEVSYNSPGGAGAGVSDFFGNLFSGIMAPFLNGIVLVGLMVGGLMMANKLGIAGAKAGMAGINKVKDGVKGYAMKKGRGVRDNVSTRIRSAGRKYDPTTGQTTTGLQRLGSKLQTIPGVRNVPGMKTIGSNIARQGAEVQRQAPEEIEKYRKENLNSLTNEAILARANSKTAFTNQKEAAAIGQELARRNLTGSIASTPGLMDRYIDVAEKMGNAQSIYVNRPDLAQRREKAPGIKETQAEATARVVRKMKVSDITNLDHDSLVDKSSPTDPSTAEQRAILLNLSNGHLGKLGSEGSREQTENIIKLFTKIQNESTRPVSPIILSPAEQDRMNQIDKFLTGSPIWSYP